MKQFQERIDKLQTELDTIRQELQIKVWTTSDIKTGIVVQAPKRDKSVILSCGWNASTQSDMYYLGGCFGQALKPFSTFAATNGATAEQMAHHFNQHHHRQLGNLKTNFDEL